MIAQSQKLKSVISGYGLPFGATATGSDWCVKALHPSDPMTEIRGIPDHSAVPSLLMNYQSTFTLSPTPGATGTWSFDASLLPHPINFMYLDLIDSNNPGGLESNFMNQQVDGVDHFNKYKVFSAMVQRWRLAYMSVTCYQDGPDLANQGSIVVCQAPVMPATYNWSYCTPIVGDTIESWPATSVYSVEDHPSFTTSQSMPNAYYGRSREGAYVPLKLTETCQDWVSDANRVGVTEVVPRFPGVTDSLYRMSGANTPVFPHVNLAACGRIGGGYVGGEATSPMLNASWAHISTKNLAVTTSFTFFVRCGIEMQVAPASILSPQLKLSPPYDPVSLNSYFQIARELKDAYPAEYNDLGKMWDLISRASKKILPVVSLIPGARMAGNVAGTVVAAGDAIRAKRQANKQASPSQQKARPKKGTPRPRRKK